MRMRRRILGFTVVLISLGLLLAGCGGKKDAGAVVKELDKQVDKLESYTTSGTMTLNTGTEPQEYKVEVSFQKPSYYRIALTNDKRDISQIVLKNDDGVFVLTPHLNKSFRFQSDWPKNQGQVYLYESLVNSINQDKDRQFTTDGDSYVFDVLANYSNASLSRQKIWINKKSFAPQTVEIYDGQNKAVVVMNFNNFKFNETFEKDYFDMQRNMTSARIALPTLGLDEHAEAAAGSNAGKAAGNTGGSADGKAASGTAANESGKTAGTTSGSAKGSAAGESGSTGKAPADKAAGSTSGAADGANQGKAAGSAGGTASAGKAGSGKAGAAPQGTSAATAQEPLSIIEPSYIPDGVGKAKMSETKVGENQAVVLKYTGDYNYTLLESRPSDKSVSYQNGDLIDLGYGFGVMTGDDMKTLIWMYEGTEFRLSSGDLPVDEMVHIAMAVQGQSAK